jgi:hypothetical protein
MFRLVQQSLYLQVCTGHDKINTRADTKGKSIFDVLEHYFKEKCIPLDNIVSVATDGTPAMVERYRGLISYLKKAVPNVVAVHCIIHRQHLVAKNLSDRLHCYYSM